MNIETTDNSPLLQECIEELISSKIAIVDDYVVSKLK